MFETTWQSLQLLLTGKLFKDNREAMRLLAAGAGAGAVVLVITSFVLPIWLASILGGAVAGGLQPYLFRNVKYA